MRKRESEKGVGVRLKIRRGRGSLWDTKGRNGSMMR